MVTLIVIRWGVRLPNLLNYALMALHNKVDKVILAVPAKHAEYVRWYLNSFYEYLSGNVVVTPMMFNVNFALIERKCADIPSPYIAAYPDVKLVEDVVLGLLREGSKRDDIVFNTAEPFWLGTYVVARDFVSKGIGALTTSSLENVLSPPIRFVWKIITKRAVQWIDKFVAHTFTAKRFLLRLGLPRERIKVAYLGIDTKRFTLKSFENLNGELTFLFVGRLDAEKGINELVKAWNKVDAHSKLQLVFVGDGILRDLVMELARKCYNVRYLGFVSDKLIPTIYHYGDVFLYLSKPKYLYGLKIWEEQFGFAPMEAMSSGLTVISSSIGALPEVIPSPPNTILNINDIESRKLANTLIKISESLSIKELRKNAFYNRLVVEKRYNAYSQSLKIADLLIS